MAGACALLLHAALLHPATARAGNDDGVLVGNDAAMSGGAVGALTDDGSATWYNPAGVAAVDRDSLDVSGSASMLRLASAGDLLSSATGRGADGGYYELLGIPSEVTLVRRLDPRTNLGLGVFVPQVTNHTDRVTLRDPLGDSVANWQLTQQESSSTYHAGITLAATVTPTLRLGATVFGTYRSFALTNQFFGGIDSGSGTDSVFGTASLTSSQSVSLEVSAGLQWQPIEGLSLGVTVRSPGVVVGSAYHVTGSALAAGPGGISFAPTEDSGLSPNFDVITPTRFRLAIAHTWERGWISLDVDAQHALDSPALGVRREWIGGVRVGARVQVDPTLALGTGLFTDLDPTRAIDAYGATRIDFFGGTLGMEFRTPHRLGEGESAPDLVFVNTVAARYALGTGQIGGLRFDAAAPMGGSTSVQPVATTVHELSLHLGSALFF